jgi:hypothetical protein
MKPSGESHIAALGLYHEETQCTGTTTQCACFGSVVLSVHDMCHLLVIILFCVYHSHRTRTILTLSLLMSYIYIYIYIYMEILVKPEMLTSYVYGPTFGNAESRLFLFAAQCFNIESMQKVFMRHSCV